MASDDSHCDELEVVTSELFPEPGHTEPAGARSTPAQSHEQRLAPMVPVDGSAAELEPVIEDLDTDAESAEPEPEARGSEELETGSEAAARRAPPSDSGRLIEDLDTDSEALNST